MLLVFIRFQPGTLVIRSWVLSVLLLSVGFFLSGIGPTLPVWATVIGTNDAFVEHTIQITSQVETSLNAVRNFYKRTRSLPETESFIENLGFDRSVIDNIYLIATDGRIVIAHDPQAIGRSASDRDYT